jgi:hypothetical protein
MLVREALGLPVEEPAWLARAAVGRISVSSAALLGGSTGSTQGSRTPTR